MLAAGDTVAGYRIDGILGRGGMGVVYTATQLSLNRTVALKFLADILGEDPDFRERFRREGLIQAALDHPHIVPVYEAGEVDDGLFLAMRLVRGENLKELIVSGQLGVARTLRVLGPIADALDTAHEAGLIHRDIKPQNILVGGRDHAYLADFGLTKEAGATGVTKTGQFVGTFDYVSPELISGHHGDRRSDLYALAAVLFECLTGQVPFVRATDAALLYAHVADPVPAVTALRADLPEAIDGVIAQALAKDPDTRQASATAMIEEAAAALADVADEAPGPFGAPFPSEPGRAPTTARGTTRASRRETPAGALETRVSRREQETPVGARALAAGVVTPPPQDTARPAAPASWAAPPAGPDAAPASAPATAPTTRGPVVSPPPTVPSRHAAPETVVSDREVVPETRVSDRPPPVATRRPLVPIAAIALLAAAAAAFLLGRAGSDDPQPAPAEPTVLAGGGVQLAAPAGFTRAKAPVIPGLDFTAPLAARAGASGIVAGVLPDASGPTLLPERFVSGLGAPPTTDDRVKLGDHEAVRYRDLRPNGFDQPLTLYVVPLSEGAAAVACYGADGCDETAASLKLEGHEALPVGPDAALAEELEALADDLRSARTAADRALAKARTRRAQAAALATLATAYRTAAGDEPEARPAEREIVRDIFARTRGAATAYAGVARAARAGRERAYDTARSRARRAESALQTAFGRLEDAGYAVG
jgi:serine/threonine-protein kinase